MADYDIRKLQLRLLDMLTDFDRLCREHGLRYYLIYGSMLGAVRHRGFIPWDDDMDLGMPRPDYDRLIAHWREWMPSHLELVCAETDATYPVAFAKVQDTRTTLIERPHYYYLGGIYIDIMPLDGIGGGWLARRLHILRYVFWSRVLYLVHRDPYRHGHGPSSWAPRLCQHFFTLGGVQKRIRRILTRYPYDESALVCHYDDSTHAVMPRSVFGEPKPVDFEGHTVMGVSQPEPYLRACYGPTYMQLPPEEQRRVHGFYYLDFDHPYRHYRKHAASGERSS